MEQKVILKAQNLRKTFKLSKKQQALEKTKPKKNYWYNALMAFLFGGAICLMGQELLYLYNVVLKLDENLSKTLMYATVIILASIVTGLGYFDNIGQVAGAGTYLPITGFANSMTSAAVESRSEGLIFGILSNMFKLAGTVIVTGVISAFFVSTILYLVML